MRECSTDQFAQMQLMVRTHNATTTPRLRRRLIPCHRPGCVTESGDQLADAVCLSNFVQPDTKWHIVPSRRIPGIVGSAVGQHLPRDRAPYAGNCCFDKVRVSVAQPPVAVPDAHDRCTLYKQSSATASTRFAAMEEPAVEQPGQNRACIKPSYTLRMPPCRW